MEDKAKSLDEIISEDCRGDLKKARDFFKSVVQDILSSSEFRIENTVCNSAFTGITGLGKTKQRVYDYKTQILENDPQIVENIMTFINGLPKEQKPANKSDKEYKNFIEQLVSVENYFDKSEGKEQKIKEVYDKIESSLKSKNENNMPFADSHTFGNIVMLNNNRDEFESIALNLQGEAINSVDNLSEEKKKEIDEWKNLFVTLTKLKVWNPSPAEVKNILSSLKSGSGFHIKVDWRDKSIYDQLDDRQKELLEKMEKENADRALKKKCQEYIKSKTYGHENDLFSILDAIAAVDLELCMKELDELTKSKEKAENAEEDKKNDNENKIIINEEPNPTKEKEEKVKDIKEQLKHRARLLGFNNSDAFCDVIDKISTEPIDQFKNFVKNCQDKFDKYQKDYGFIPVVSAQTKNEEAEKPLIEVVSKAKNFMLNIVKVFYTEAKKQAREILKQKKEDEKDKDNPKILAVEFVLDLMDNMDNMDNKNLNTEISEELRFLVNGTKQLDEKDDFGFENLQSIVKSMGSNKNLLDQNSVKKFYDLLSKIDSDYCKIILEAINSLKDEEEAEFFFTGVFNQKNGTLVSDFFAFAFDDKQKADQNLEYTKKFLSVIVGQVFVNFENDFECGKFLSLVFKPYFDKKISGANTIEELEPIIKSVGSFLKDFCLSEDVETSLNLLIQHVDDVKDKDDLDAFFDSYAWSLDDVKNDDVKQQYANRNLLVDLQEIFLDKNLDSKVAIGNISLVVNLLTKLDRNEGTEEDFKGLSNVLLAYAKKLIGGKIANKFPLLEATLKFQLKPQNLKVFDTNEKQKLFKRLVNIKKNGLQDEDKEDLRDYFWGHAMEIFKQKKEFTEAEAGEFYGFIRYESKEENLHCRLLFIAIYSFGLAGPQTLVNMFNQDDNFKNILTLKNGTAEEKEKACKSILQFLIKQKLKVYETQEPQNKFLSSAFGKYFLNNINDAKKIDDLNKTITLVKDFTKNNYLSSDPKTSLDVLIDNAGDVTNKNDLVAFFTFVADSVNKMNDIVGYENRKLLVDLKDIFLDDVMYQFKNSNAIVHIGSVAKLLTNLDNKTDIKKYGQNDFFGLGEVLYDYEQKSIKNKIANKFPLLEATLKFQLKPQNLKVLDTNEKQKLFKRLVNIKKNGLQDEDKEDLKNYFWSHATEIFKQKEEFTEAKAKEFYGFIQDEKNGDNQYFKLLNSAINTLGLSTQKYLVEILNQDDNFKNIILLKNGEGEEKEKAYKSILKSLVKQKLNQKGGFVAGAYLKYYEKQIDNNKITDESQNEIVSGVNKVLNDDFRPEIKILIAAVDELKDKDKDKDNKALSDFWKSCRKSEKDQTQAQKKEEKKSIVPVNNQSMDNKAGNNGKENEMIIDTSDNKNEKKDISNNDKILDALSYIFIDLLEHDRSKVNDENNINNIINEAAGLNLVEITKQFVSSLYGLNKNAKKTEDISTTLDEQKTDNQLKEDNTGITKVLNRYYDTFDKYRLSTDSLGVYGSEVLLAQINNFQNLDGDSQIKLLQCMKNIKNNSLTNDDLVYINLCAYEIKKEQLDNSFDSPFKELKLITDPNDNNNDSGKTLVEFFQSYGGSIGFTKMSEDQIKSVIKNIGKGQITDSQEKKNFAGAVVFVLEKQIQYLKNYYENNNYEEIDQIEDKYKTDWKNLIDALDKKHLLGFGQKEDFDRQIDNACDLYAVVGALEWILSALAAIFVIPLASKTIRKTLHSPLKSRKTRHLIKSADTNNGIFSMLNNFAHNPIPAQENNVVDNQIKGDK